MDKTLMECLRWERDHGYRSEADYTRCLEDDATAGRVVTLQEGSPTSYGKGKADEKPTPLDDLLHARLAAGITGAPRVQTLQEMAATPLPWATRRTPVVLTESRSASSDLHARLYQAIKG